MSHDTEKLLSLATRFEKQSNEFAAEKAPRFEKPLIYRLIEQQIDALKIGDVDTFKELQEVVDEERARLKNFKYEK